MQQLWQNRFNNFVKVAYSSREAYSITLSAYTWGGGGMAGYKMLPLIGERPSPHSVR